ncbi:FAD-binding oxidoreductase [Bacillus luteolus]|uniref:FAD-binding oxidoreductase n=1 Tax=Litchfieldia luteola TaxID=682179 RepID=A0ABR9QJ46_9BACI|nr:FAD-binding oxidoreductase [Cytobacillus luteolus]MBE4908528.1 FAD-binding oxidoreductase [Cytobacillus luteolus]MBP1941380.1 sarcosine oxidase subunit beta [Cytobacillus luteolus]
MENYEVVIVGAGVIGCSIAYFLTEQGYSNVLVIDKGGIASDITGICPGGVRQQWGTEINCVMSKASTDFFQNINEHLHPEYEIKFRNVGYLYTFHSDEAKSRYAESVALQNSLGIPTRFLTPQEAKEIVPGINESSFLSASFCETDGFADDAYHVTNSFANAAKRKGVKFVSDDVEKIVLEQGVVKGVYCEKRGYISADKVVNAAGLGSKKLAKTAGVELPIDFEVRRILYTNRITERILEPLLISFEKGFAAKQLTDGTVYLSYLGKDVKPPFNMFDFQLRAAEVGIELFPPLENLVFHTHIDGTYDSTPDHQAILGDVDGLPGYYQAVGMSGHGFMMSPAIGESVASLVAEKTPTLDVSSLHFRRFANNKLIFEPSVV